MIEHIVRYLIVKEDLSFLINCVNFFIVVVEASYLIFIF